MANKIDSVVAKCPITSPADKFYNFFKLSMTKVVEIFPAAFTEAVVVEGTEGEVGCVTKWNYILGAIPLSAKVRTEAVNDGTKSITFVVLEGDLLLLYKSFKATLVVGENYAEWTFVYEKATLLSPPPELYVPLAITMCTLVDAFLHLN